MRAMRSSSGRRRGFSRLQSISRVPSRRRPVLYIINTTIEDVSDDVTKEDEKQRK
jgi:hypothetical protein